MYIISLEFSPTVAAVGGEFAAASTGTSEGDGTIGTGAASEGDGATGTGAATDGDGVTTSPVMERMGARERGNRKACTYPYASHLRRNYFSYFFLPLSAAEGGAGIGVDVFSNEGAHHGAGVSAGEGAGAGEAGAGATAGGAFVRREDDCSIPPLWRWTYSL